MCFTLRLLCSLVVMCESGTPTVPAGYLSVLLSLCLYFTSVVDVSGFSSFRYDYLSYVVMCFHVYAVGFYMYMYIS